MEELHPTSELDEIRSRLARVMNEEYVETWLSIPQAFLNHHTPLDIINGDDEEAKEQLRRVISGFENPPAA